MDENLVESGQLAESREERNRPTLSFVRTVRFFFLLVATVIVATGCGGTRVETSRIDCSDANNVAITANLVAVVSGAGDFIDGNSSDQRSDNGPLSHEDAPAYHPRHPLEPR